MAVTKQTYTVTATWTAVQLADITKQALIDAGLMTDWFDSFLSGTVENRILRVINDGSKAYGTVYYWFMFTTAGAWLSTTSTWNATTHVPTGTQYLDYYSTTTNATTNHRPIAGFVNTTNATLTRYTSTVNSSVSVFLFRQSTSSNAFMLSSPGFNCTSVVDQNILQYNKFLHFVTGTGSSAAYIDVCQGYATRASYMGAATNRVQTNVSEYIGNNVRRLQRFLAPGNWRITGYNYELGPAFMLPVAYSSANPALGSNYMPVCTSPTLSPYMPPMPSDFAMIPYYASNTMVVQDTFVVTPGVEEWEIIVLSVNGSTSEGVDLYSKIFFAAKVIG